MLEADDGIAQSLKEQGKLDEALTLLSGLIQGADRDRASCAQRAMLLGGIIMGLKAEAAAIRTKGRISGAAIDYLSRLASSSRRSSDRSCRVYRWVRQLLEQQANGSKDTKFKNPATWRVKALTSNCLRMIRTASLPPRPRSAAPLWAVESEKIFARKRLPPPAT